MSCGFVCAVSQSGCSYLVKAAMTKPDKIFQNAINALNVKKFPDAERLFKSFLKSQPKHVGALNLLTIALMSMKRFEEAKGFVEKALRLDQSSDVSFYNYGIILKNLSKPRQALEQFDSALKLNPNVCETWNNRGTVLNDLKEYERAVTDFDRAIILNARYVDACANKGKSLGKLKRYDEALVAFDKALALKPDLADAWLGRGNVYCGLRQYDEALVAYDKALALKHDLAEAWLGRGNVFFSTNRDHEARTCYDKSISVKNDIAEAYWSKSLLTLSLGEYEEGWQLYEWRWRTQEFPSPLRAFDQPLWLGDNDISNKTILIHSEQGLGDAIHFYRYLSFFKGLNCTILFEIPKILISLFNRQSDNIHLIAKGGVLPHFDVHCPLMSLPLAFKTSLNTIPAHIPYLRPDEKKVTEWRGRVGDKAKPRIGLAWAGNQNLRNDAARSIRLEKLAPIITEVAEWYSLQKDVRDYDREHLAALHSLNDFTNLLDDFSDTAAMIAALDLVITVDTAVAHLAGALGKTVWILLPFHPDFRWLRNREDTPWYPTARLFRQIKDGEWDDVVEKISQDLGRLFANCKTTSWSG
jgi:tetratricopeptide (TPR) repeat protein